MNANMSLYIPRVFSNISKERIADVFECLRLGKVNRIDFVAKMDRNNDLYNAVYVHFEYWYSNDAARNFQERLMNPEKETRVVYDDPWYWIVLENKGFKHVSGDRKQRVFIDETIETANDYLETPQKMMSNADFAAMVNAPMKNYAGKQNLYNADEDFATVCRTIDFDSDAYEANMMEKGVPSWNVEEENLDDDLEEILDQMNDSEDFSQNFVDYDMVDSTYAAKLEQENTQLRNDLNNICKYIHQTKILQEENQTLRNELYYLRELRSIDRRIHPEMVF